MYKPGMGTNYPRVRWDRGEGGSRGAIPTARASPRDWARAGGGVTVGQWDWGSENAGMKAMYTPIVLHYVHDELMHSTAVRFCPRNSERVLQFPCTD